jgi:hypothetical protein
VVSLIGLLLMKRLVFESANGSFTELAFNGQSGASAIPGSTAGK